MMAAEVPSPSSRLEIAKCVLLHSPQRSTERRSCAAGYASPMSPVDEPRASATPESPSAARRRARDDWTADVLDAEAGRIGVPLLDADGIRELLASTRRIAIVGASPDPHRPSHGVLRDLRALGYEVVP